MQASKTVVKGGKDCIVCTLCPLLKLGSFFGVFPLTFTCQHNNKNVTKGNFKSSKKLRLLSAVITIILFVAIVWYIYLATKISQSNKLLFIQILAETFYFLCGFTLVAFSLFNVKKRVVDLNGWIALCENRYLFGVPSIIDAETTVKLHRRGKIYLLASCSFLFLLCMFIFVRDYQGFTHWTTFRRPACVLSTFVQLVTVFELAIHEKFLGALFYSFENYVKSLLLNDLQKENIQCIADVEVCLDGEKVTLESKLKAAHKFYHAVLLNFKVLNSYVAPTTCVWFLLILMVLTVNIYILVFVWINDQSSTFFIMLEIRTYFILFAITYLLQCVEDVSNANNGLLSFLYKYPISKLTSSEALQVETLITALSIQKPTLRASNIFVIGTRLLAPIAGTVTTYVLVALQFHAFWDH